MGPHALDVRDSIGSFDRTPLRNNVKGCGNAEQLLQDQRAALRWLLAQRENARVIAVKGQVAGMGFKRRTDQIFVGHYIKLKPLLLLARIDIEDPAQHPESLLFMQ